MTAEEGLDGIEARLTVIERDVSEIESWMGRRFDQIDAALAAIQRHLGMDE